MFVPPCSFQLIFPAQAKAAALVTRSPRPQGQCFDKGIVYRDFKNGFYNVTQPNLYYNLQNEYGRKNKRDIYEEYQSIIRKKIYFNFTEQFKFQRQQPQNANIYSTPLHANNSLNQFGKFSESCYCWY